MRLVRNVIVVAAVALCAIAAQAATVTSSFNNFVYSYVVTPAVGEAVKSFHIYIPSSEADAAHYYSRVMPAGWLFDVVTVGTESMIVWWTEGSPLPEGVPANFGYTHYCAPCCHSWYLSDVGSTARDIPIVDDDSQHSEPCGISAPFNDLCGGPGTVVAPIYPQAVPEGQQAWGAVKALYR